MASPTERPRTLLGLPFRDALLVMIVTFAIALTIAAWAARILGAPAVGAATGSLGGPSLERSSMIEEPPIPVSNLGGTLDDQ